MYFICLWCSINTRARAYLPNQIYPQQNFKENKSCLKSRHGDVSKGTILRLEPEIKNKSVENERSDTYLPNFRCLKMVYLSEEISIHMHFLMLLSLIQW